MSAANESQMEIFISLTDCDIKFRIYFQQQQNDQ